MITSECLVLTRSKSAEPVLRWAGSKRRITPILASCAPKKYSRYIEPFAGSGALYFHLQPDRAILGDVNREVTTTYQAIKDNPEEVHAYLDGIPRTKNAYLAMREVSLSGLSDSQRAARLIFLMKGCFNGVYRTNKQGHFNVPFGSAVFKLPNLDDLRRVSRCLKGTEVIVGDYKSWITSEAQKGDFFYLDPPYSSSTRFRGEYGYNTAFKDNQLQELLTICQTLDECKASVMLSYKWSEDISKILTNWRILELPVPRSVSGKLKSRNVVTELLAMNY